MTNKYDLDASILFMSIFAAYFFGKSIDLIISVSELSVEAGIFIYAGIGLFFIFIIVFLSMKKEKIERKNIN